MHLPGDTTIQIGNLGIIAFEKGTYLYIGSAPSQKRLERHLRKEKKIHWHIDYFLQEASVEKIFIAQEDECELAHHIKLPYIRGFGCSDCLCPSHLFHGELSISASLEHYYP